MDQHTGGRWLIHGTKHHKDNQLESLELPAEYPSIESKHDIKESEGNMFNPIFKGNVQGRKHPGRCAFVEPELLSYRKSKHVAQNENNGHKNINNNNNYHDEIELFQGISKRTHKETQQQRNAHRQNSSINCDGCSWPMNNVTWYLYPYYMIEHAELYNSNIHLKPSRKE